MRFTIVPRAVFLNSGTLNIANYAGVTSGVPALGTLPASTTNQPAEQSQSGVGGEFQISARNFAGALGYTPYEFLVRNVTGRVLFKPSDHFTLYVNRDSVTETELSYAGLRDPGTVSAVFAGKHLGRSGLDRRRTPLRLRRRACGLLRHGRRPPASRATMCSTTTSSKAPPAPTSSPTPSPAMAA